MFFKWKTMDPLSVRQECHVEGIVGNGTKQNGVRYGASWKGSKKGPNISSQHGRCVEALSWLIS